MASLTRSQRTSFNILLLVWWIMEKVAVDFVAILTLVTAVIGDRISELIPKDANVKEVRCLYSQSCSLLCPFEGVFRRGSYIRVDTPLMPIAVLPERHTGQRWHGDYRGMSSMSLQPGGGAVLQISTVQVKHQGFHRCSVTSSTGHTDRFFSLLVYTPVNVSLREEGQQLVCSAERIYPEPSVAWTPPSSDSNGTQISVSKDGMFTVSSSVSLPSTGAANSYTCNISTPYSYGTDVFTPSVVAADHPDLESLWMLLGLVLVAVVVFLIYCCWKNRHKENKKNNKNTPTSTSPGEDKPFIPNGTPARQQL